MILTPYSDIPEKFRWFANDNPFVRFVTDWFLNGITIGRFEVRKEVDKEIFLRNILAQLSSREIPREHNIAGCAYYASQHLTYLKYTCNGKLVEIVNE